MPIFSNPISTPFEKSANPGRDASELYDFSLLPVNLILFAVVVHFDFKTASNVGAGLVPAPPNGQPQGLPLQILAKLNHYPFCAFRMRDFL
jgi:hypothetical protein